MSSATAPVSVPVAISVTPPTPPILAPAPGTSAVQKILGVQEEGKAHEFLSQNKWPIALQDIFLRNLARTPIRFFICDDSGSMEIHDGRIFQLVNDIPRELNCSRWKELGHAMNFHIRFASTACISTEVRFLNSLNPVNIGCTLGEGSEAKDRLLRRFADSEINGGTPLCKHISEIIEQIRALEDQLRSTGQRACIIIATDGESSDGDIIEALRPLQDLPAWVVVRLCTEEENISEYWNKVDSILEVDMDVVDDLIGEAAAINKANPWLNYNEILHRMREFGVSLKEFDMIDEQLLTPEQMLRFCKSIFGEAIDNLPLLQVDFPAFIQGMTALNKAAPKVWSPISKRYTEWLNISELSKCYGPKGGCACVIS